MIKVLVLTGVNSRNAGGLFNSVKSLSFALDRINEIDISILSFDDEFSKEDLYTWGNLPMLKYKVLGPLNFGLSLNVKKRIDEIDSQIIHQQGIWTYASKEVLNSKNKKHTITIITPRGMLDAWAINNSSLKKKIIGSLFEYKNLKKANCIHALCEPEYKSIRSFGLKNPVAIIPNGINLPEINRNEYLLKKNKKKNLLFISRIHPKKGLLVLFKAFVKLKEINPFLLEEWRFTIAGWSQGGHQEELEQFCSENKLDDFVNFIGPVYEETKQKELLSADAFILPSFSEGLPMSILEAWSYKLPVLMTKECNIPEGFINKAAFELTHDLDELTIRLNKILSLDKKEFKRCGNNGYELVKNNFTWNKIAQQTHELYNWLLNKGETPKFVRLN